MKKSNINPTPKYFDRYINLIEDLELDAAFSESLEEIANFDWEKCHALGLKTYAPDKWTAPDILQHLLDWERIMTFRALGFARGVFKKAQGIDEDVLARNTGANDRTIADLREEMTTLRHATRHFFKTLNGEQLLKPGICWESKMSPLALGFTILGHQRHHFLVLRERYFPVLES